MSNNYKTIWSGVPSAFQGAVLTASAPSALTTSDGVITIGTNGLIVFTAAATYGSYLSSIRCTPYATAAATATTATVLRFYLASVGTGTTTTANCKLIAEQAVGAQTADSSTSAVLSLEIPINRALPPGSFIIVTQHAVAAANTGWHIVPFAGDYVATP